MADLFDLEQKILSCWNITDELELIARYIKSGEVQTTDIPSVLVGLNNLYSIKFDDLFNEFSKVNKFNHE